MPSCTTLIQTCGVLALWVLPVRLLFPYTPACGWMPFCIMGVQMAACGGVPGSGPAKDPSKGMGPLRIWPGGVANARTIGDLESNGSQLLLPSPAISQAREAL